MTWDELNKEAGIKTFADLNKEAGIAPVPTATAMLKQEQVRTQDITQRIAKESPDVVTKGTDFDPFNLSEEAYKQDIRTIRDTAAAPAEKLAAIDMRTKARLSERMGEFQQVVQTPFDLKAMVEDQKKLNTRGKKMSRRVDRGVAMLAGGGAHVVDTILQMGDGHVTASGPEVVRPGEVAREMHKLMQSPTMQPRIDDWVDKYVGGGVESAPFMLASMAPAVLTGGAAVPSLVAGFAVSFGVEGNNIYQTNLDMGRSEREARIRGMVGGMLSAGVEVLGGSGAKYFDSVATKAVTKLGRAKQLTGSLLKNALKEGLVEELPQEVIGMIMGGDPPRNADRSLDYGAIAQQLFDAAAIGTFTGGFVDAAVKTAGGANSALHDRAVSAHVQEMVSAKQEYDAADATAAQQQAPAPIQVPADQRSQVIGRQAQTALEAEAARSIGKPVEEFRQLSPQLQQELIRTVNPAYTDEASPDAAATADEYDTSVAESVGMTLDEARIAAPKAGPGKLTAKDLLVAPLREANKEGNLSPTERLNRKGVKNLWASIKKASHNANDSLTSIERFLERLDGRKAGPNYKFFMRLRDFGYARKEATQVEVMKAEEKLRGMGFKPEWMADTTAVRPGLELTTAHKMGVAMLAKNEKGRRNLIQGMQMTEAEVDGMFDSLTREQQQMVKYMEDTYEAQWPMIVEAAKAAGIDPKTLLKEAWYSPVSRTDIDPSEQHDMMTMLLAPFQQETHMPEKRMLIKRKSVAGEIELDAAALFLQNIARIEAFKIMAPLAADLNKVTTDQNFTKHLNRATYGEGSRILNKWIADTIRGQSVDSQQMAARISKYFRHTSMVYLLNHNVLISSKQWISIFQAMAADKNVGGAMLKNLPRLTTDFAALKAEVEDKSRMVRVRDFDREFQRKVDAESVTRTLTGKKRIDENAVGWIKKIDNITVVLTWKSLYDVAITKGMNEAEAVAYADKWVARTQPMGDAVDLPDFFRGGELAKVLTSFGRMPNQVYNLIAHDIIGAKRRGEITSAEAGRRALVGLVIPALIFGLMKRGRPQKDWKELVEDVVMYPIGTVGVVGSWAASAYQGFDPSFIGMLPFQEFVKAAKAAKAGQPRKLIVHSLKAGGAATGRIGAQAIRTGEGAYDLASGKTRDPRRLLYSEYSLTGGKKNTGGGSTARRPRRRAAPSRRK